MLSKRYLSLPTRLSKHLPVLSIGTTLLTLLIATTHNAAATLPVPVNNALTTAGLTANDISLVIIPLTPPNTINDADDNGRRSNQNIRKSHLPMAVKPKSKLDAKTYIEQYIAAQWRTGLSLNLAAAKSFSEPNNLQINQQNKLPDKLQSESQYHLHDNNLHDNKLPQNTHPLSRPIRHNAAVPRTPASTMKLIPTFVAMDTLGSDFVWYTEVYHTGYVVNHTLHGDLIIKGSGDPKLTYKRLQALLLQVKQAGIEHIDGDIILDSSIFQQVGKDPALFDNDPLRPYNASPDGLLVNFSTIEMMSAPTVGRESSLTYTPQLADYQLPDLIAQRAGRCLSIRHSLAPVWESQSLVFGKRMPRGCGTHTFYIAYPDPKEFAQRVIKQQWLTLGNTLGGEVVSTESPRLTPYGNYSATQAAKNLSTSHPTLLSSSRLPMASLSSFPLARQIYDINHHSNNVMTEQLMLSLAAYGTDTAQSVNPWTANRHYATYSDAINLIEDWWQQHLDTPPPVMTNGSGLCRTCTVTADNLAQLLQYAYHHPDFNNYINSMGIAGIDGTIAGHKWRKPDSAAIGRAWIKTGTLDNVTAMAGYVKGRSEQDYVVVGIINTPHKLNATKARRVLDTLLDWTAQH